MSVSLTLLYSKNVKTDLIKDMELKEIDEITSKYKDEEHLREDPELKEKIQEFYRRNSRYCAKIKNPQDRLGNIEITYHSEEGFFKRIQPI